MHTAFIGYEKYLITSLDVNWGGNNSNKGILIHLVEVVKNVYNKVTSNNG